MKMTKWLLLLSAIGLVGCAQVNFDPKDEYVLYAKGKAYAIPFGVNYNSHIPPQTYTMIRNAGIPCSNNGVTWHEKAFSDEMKRKSRHSRDVMYYLKYGYDHNLVGCSEPLKKEAYDALLVKQSRTVTHRCPQCQKGKK